MNKKLSIKVYHGFGHTHDIMVFGHVFRKKIPERRRFSNNRLVNFFHLLRLFFVKPVAGVKLELNWEGQGVAAITETDGFFRAEWTAHKETFAGWHDVTVHGKSKGVAIAPGVGKVFIPHKTQFGFISDIDDTVMVSHSATVGKRLKELLFKNPHSRSIFPGVAEHYRLLAAAHTRPDEPNPFFYVSSSEWNLYDYLRETFAHQHLPNGAFLLNQVKRWYELAKTGKTKHEGKLLRILRVLEVFPNQRFVLMGDNSQSDPGIYSKLCEKYADRIFAVYIRNVSAKNEAGTQALMDGLEQKGVHTLQFRHSSEAIAHSKHIGLI